MHLRGEREVLGALGNGVLELDQGRGGAGLEVEQGAGDEVGEDPDRVHRGGGEAGGGEQRVELLAGEPPTGPAVRLGGVQQRLGLLEVAGHRPRHHRGVPLGDEQAEHAAGAEHLGDRGERGGRVVDDLEHPVAQHHVGGVRTGDVEQGGQVALLAGDPVGDAALVGPTVQGRQGVRAGVDDPDPVAELGDPDGEPAGAAADVEHVARGAVQDRAQGLPHDGRAGGAAAFAGGHVANPNGVIIRRSRGCGATACGRRPWCSPRPA